MCRFQAWTVRTVAVLIASASLSRRGCIWESLSLQPCMQACAGLASGRSEAAAPLCRTLAAWTQRGITKCVCQVMSYFISDKEHMRTCTSRVLLGNPKPIVSAFED